MRAFAVVVGVSWFASLSFIGCGAKTDSPAPVAEEQLPEQEFPEKLAEAVCDHIGPCCQTAQISFDLASCKQTASARVSANMTAIETANVRYDAAAAARCVALYASTVQSCSTLDNAALVAACSAAFVGTLAPGAVCTKKAECARGPNGERATCKLDTAGVHAVCALDENSLTGKLGGACTAGCFGPDDSLCSFLAGDAPASPSLVCYASNGLFCSAAQTCQALVPLGGACRSDACVAGAFCESQTCVAARTTGPCQSPLACANPTYCDFATGQCEPKKADGAPCLATTDCLSNDCGYQQDSSSQRTCLTKQLASTNTCAGNIE